MIELRILGSTDLGGPDGEELHAILAQPKRFALLAYLVIAKPRGFHRRDKLLGLFWPELDQERARGALRKALYFLRSGLGETVLVGRGDDEVGVGDGTLSCDVVAFENAVDAGEWEKALKLYRGDALEGFYVADSVGFEQWLELERMRLRRRAAEAGMALSAEEEEAGRGDLAVKAARRVTQLLPNDQPAICDLMGVMDRTGDRVGAIRVYEAFAQDLEEEFGIGPSPETVELAEAIRGRSESNGNGSGNGNGYRNGNGNGNGRARTHPDPLGPEQGIEEDDATDAAVPGTLAGNGSSRRWAAVAVVLVAGSITIGGSGWMTRQDDPVSPLTILDPLALPTLAVLPFTMMEDTPTDDILARGLNETLITKLAQVGGLRVLSHGAVVREERETGSIRELGRRLRASGVVSGTIQRVDERVRITAQLVDVETEAVLWADTYDRAPTDILATQSEVAASVVTALQLSLSRAERQRLVASTDVNPEAWALVQRARELSQDYFASDRLLPRPVIVDSADVLLANALRLDPEYAPAFALRSQIKTYHHLYNRWATPVEMLDTALVMANRAVELDGEGLEGYSARMLARLGRVARIHDTEAAPTFDDLLGGAEDFLTAVRLNPSFVLLGGGVGPRSWEVCTPEPPLSCDGPQPSGHILVWRHHENKLKGDWWAYFAGEGHTYWMLGDFEQAERSIKRALELKPEDENQKLRLAQVYLTQGRLDEARVVIEDALVRHPDYEDMLAPAILLAIADGNYDEAEAYLRPVVGVREAFSTSSLFPRTSLGFVLLKTGRSDEAERLLEDSRERRLRSVERGTGWITFYELGRIHAMRGELEEANDWIEQSISRGWNFYHTYMGLNDPMLENLMEDERFLALMEGVRVEVVEERAWAEELEALPESQRFERMLADVAEWIERAKAAQAAVG